MPLEVAIMIEAQEGLTWLDLQDLDGRKTATPGPVRAAFYFVGGIDEVLAKAGRAR
jgi:hypothetical protein